MNDIKTFTAFLGDAQIAAGPLEQLLPPVKAKFDRPDCPLILIFADATGKQVDFELRGSLEGVLAGAIPPKPKTGPGRPKLGVVAREISLLPRHWEWLEQHSSGASAAIRRLIDEARKQEPSRDRIRRAKEATGRVLTALAGDRPGYEEATRALSAGNADRFKQEMKAWPKDVRAYVTLLAKDAFLAAA